MSEVERPTDLIEGSGRLGNPTLKISDVSCQSATYHPRAECECGNFSFQQANYDPKGKAKDLAKRHLLASPTHAVTVTQETVSVYYVPEHLQQAHTSHARSESPDH